MSTISKTSVPSLFDSCTNILLAAAVLKQHAGFRKQEKYSTPMDTWSRVVSHINKEGTLELCSFRKGGQNLISKGLPSSSQLECFDYRREHEFSNCIFTNILIAVIVYKYLQELHADTAYIRACVLLKNLLEVFLKSWKLMISAHFFRQILTEMKSFTKYLEYFHQAPEMLVVLGSFCLQMPIKKTTFAKESSYFHKYPKILTNLRTFCSEMRLSESFSNILEFHETRKMFQLTFQQMPSTKKSPGENSGKFMNVPEIPVSTTASDRLKSLKCNGKCYLCQEMISEKKFFDERRFGILNKCDCMICYGCLRKTANTSGVVRGPIRCPSCSIESSSVAASASWIEGEQKFIYFNLMQDYEVLENNLDWTTDFFQSGMIKETVWSTPYLGKFGLQRFEASSADCDLRESEAFSTESETLQECWNFHRAVGHEKSEFFPTSPLMV